jgi:LysR family transcriptional regulator for metE and metH
MSAFLSLSGVIKISMLEEKLGITLWEREGRNLRLTKAGELLLQTAQQL